MTTDLNHILGEYTLEEAFEYFVRIDIKYKGAEYTINDRCDEPGIFSVYDENKIYARYPDIKTMLHGELFGRPFKDVIKDSEIVGVG